jgi:hypothetical protein
MNQSIIDILKEQSVGDVVISALTDLLNQDSYLLMVDANERSITHRLAMYLQSRLPDLHVDCEYNRDGIDPKRIKYLGLNPHDEDADAKTVFPDIIAHIRNSKNNYLVIEVKKSTSTVDRDVDISKLQGYKTSLGYKFALFIELDTGDKAGVGRVEWINT